MGDFQRHMSRLRKDPAFAAAFDKRRAQAEVAFQIRRLREAKGLTQKELARKVGCSQQAIFGNRASWLWPALPSPAAPHRSSSRCRGLHGPSG